MVNKSILNYYLENKSKKLSLLNYYLQNKSNYINHSFFFFLSKCNSLDLSLRLPFLNNFSLSLS